MKKRYAIITDIHGNLEALNAVLDDIKTKDIDEIFCLGDIINLGTNSKECVDRLIEENVKSALGNHELYLLRGTEIDPRIEESDKEHFEWVKKSLTDKEINYIKGLPLYYELTVDYDGKAEPYKIVLCHYLINDEKKKNPFESNHLKDDVNLWIKYNADRIEYVIGHLHKSFNENEVDGISEDYIEAIDELTNIDIVDSLGCSYDDYASYLIIDISKGISYKREKVKYDRDTFIDKMMNTDIPDKKYIMKTFYGVDI